MRMSRTYELSAEDVLRRIGMPGENGVPFAGIEAPYGVPECDVMTLVRRRLNRSSWELWRERVSGRESCRLRARQQPAGSGHRARRGRT